MPNTPDDEQRARVHDAYRRVVEAQEVLTDAQRHLADVQREIIKEMEADA